MAQPAPAVISRSQIGQGVRVGVSPAGGPPIDRQVGRFMTVPAHERIGRPA